MSQDRRSFIAVRFLLHIADTHSFNAHLQSLCDVVGHRSGDQLDSFIFCTQTIVQMACW
jgi:hypothetical protein